MVSAHKKICQQLWQIGDMFEHQKQPDWALLAYSSIRSSFYASRSFYTPGKDWINRCDEKIAGINVAVIDQRRVDYVRRKPM